MPKTIEQIRHKIEAGTVRIVRADEMTAIVRERGAEQAALEVDVVTTGTFGAMCSSGVWLNFGHSDPPIRMSRVRLNGVEAYAGVAAVDAYLGATQASEDRGIAYGGAHVIEGLLRGEAMLVQAESDGTDCYPRKTLAARVTLADLNSAVMSNPRNAYQRYNAAVNTGPSALRTYMGTLMPRAANVSFSGAGELSPLMNDPGLRSIGIGSPVFLGGAVGHVTGPGTQHNPGAGFATLMVQGDLKAMSPEFVRAAVWPGYGPTLYIGLGAAIPVLDAEAAAAAGISDAAIETDIVDYAVSRRDRPVLRRATYAELKSGTIEIAGRTARTSPLSSFAMARRIAEELKRQVAAGRFPLAAPVAPLPKRAIVRGLSREAEIDNEAAPGTRPAAFLGAIPRPEKAEVALDAGRCLQCGFCLAICPDHVFVRDEGWAVSARVERCRACGMCAAACPAGALRVEGVRS
jgi:L-aspartate semialdehyde sulfurtransferase